VEQKPCQEVGEAGAEDGHMRETGRRPAGRARPAAGTPDRLWVGSSRCVSRWIRCWTCSTG
jgi:hypothetical protein